MVLGTLRGKRIALSLAAIAAGFHAAQAAGNLVFEKVLPIEASELLQPSGLVSSGGSLYMVSSKEDGSILKLTVQSDKVTFAPALAVKPPTGDGSEEARMIWRALSADPEGNFYLLSETMCRILRVKKDGGSEWLGPGLLEAGVEKDLFAGDNAGADGIAFMGPGRFYVGAARQPRGMFKIDLSGEKPKLSAFKMEKTTLKWPPGKKPDLVDLAVDGKTAYGLMGGADAVCRIKTAGEGYEEGECWSFSSSLGDAKYRYMGLKTGLGRGLAIDANGMYLVVDNKGMPRESDPKDRRAQLFFFKRPGA